MRQLERRLHALKPELKGSRLEISGGFTRAPLERKMSAALFARAKTLAAEMNLTLEECAVGGGSDGNFTAAAGIPTLDGLGAVGDGAHSTHEHILTKTMPQRAALLAALLHPSKRVALHRVLGAAPSVLGGCGFRFNPANPSATSTYARQTHASASSRNYIYVFLKYLTVSVSNSS